VNTSQIIDDHSPQTKPDTLTSFTNNPPRSTIRDGPPRGRAAGLPAATHLM
jgi:hypothetical protein